MNRRPSSCSTRRHPLRKPAFGLAPVPSMSAPRLIDGDRTLGRPVHAGLDLAAAEMIDGRRNDLIADPGPGKNMMSLRLPPSFALRGAALVFLAVLSPASGRPA